MIKKLISMLLAVALTLSIVTVVAPTAKADPEPTPTQSQEQLPNYVKFEGTEEFTIKMEEGWSGKFSVNLQYSTDGTSWSDYSDTNRPAVSSSNKVLYFRGTNDALSSIDEWEMILWNEFKISPNNNGTVAASGNIMALLDYNNPSTTLTASNAYAFHKLFYDCTALTSAPSLPATTMAEKCYYAMFCGCTSLTQAPELPATTLAKRCYESMFSGCTSLTDAPELPAIIMEENCYDNMFCGCTSLTDAPELKSTSLAYRCYAGMFSFCTSLTTAPELPATTLANTCYESMFWGCTSLTDAPELKSTSLAEGCYSSMFSECTSLKEAPKLPATTLANECYRQMFSGCTALTEVPKLPATTLADSCYYNMFYQCTSLKKAPKLVATTLANSCYQGMFLYCSSLMIEETTSEDDALWIMPSTTTATNWNTDMLTGTSGSATSVELGKMYKIELPNYVKFEGTEEFTIQMAKFGSTATVTLQYSTDGTQWNDYDNSTRPAISSGKNKVVYFRGTNERLGTSASKYNYFVINPSNGGTVAASGNIMALLNYSSPATTIATYAFLYLFKNCSSLTSAPALPATTLSKACYRGMFYNCTALTSAPALPATTLALECYCQMFYGCTGLTEAPELKATTLADNCCSDMFSGCTGLTEAPELNATTLAKECYSNMFKGCTALTSAPALPATTLTRSCYYQMFDGCTGLIEAPELNATTLADHCCFSMFKDCTGLTKAPELKATTLADSCYVQMFYGCTNLKMKETTDASKALWVMPSSTKALNWNKDILAGTSGTATSVALGKMYRITSPYPYMVGETGYKTAADLNADIADGTVAEGSTIVLTGEKPDGTVVIDGKDMTIDGSALDAIVLPDDSALVNVTNKARVNVLGTMPKTDNDGTADAPIYSEGFIYLGASASSKALTTTGSVYQAKTVAEFKTAGATLTESIALSVSAEVAPKTGDVIAIAAKEGTAGATTINAKTGYYEATISGIYLTHVGNDLGLSVKANDTAVETVEDYTTVNYLSDAATATGDKAPSEAMKTLIANLIIACKYINDAGEGNKGADIDLTDSELSWMDDAKTTTAPATKSMSIDTSNECIRIASAGIHVTDKLNLFVEIEPKGKDVSVVAPGTSVKAYIKNGDNYEPLAVVDDMVITGKNAQWYAYIDKLLPTQYDSDIKIELYTNTNTLAQTLYYSVNTYCSRMSTEQSDLCKAIYNYGTAALAVAAEQ